MPDDPQPSPTAGPPPHRKIECGFCECELSSSGDYKELSARAKKLRGLETDNDKLRADLASSNGTIDTLRQEIEDLKKKLESKQPDDPPKKKRFLFSS